MLWGRRLTSEFGIAFDWCFHIYVNARDDNKFSRIIRSHQTEKPANMSQNHTEHSILDEKIIEEFKWQTWEYRSSNKGHLSIYFVYWVVPIRYNGTHIHEEIRDDGLAVVRWILNLNWLNCWKLAVLNPPDHTLKGLGFSFYWLAY